MPCSCSILFPSRRCSDIFFFPCSPFTKNFLLLNLMPDNICPSTYVLWGPSFAIPRSFHFHLRYTLVVSFQASLFLNYVILHPTSDSCSRRSPLRCVYFPLFLLALGWGSFLFRFNYFKPPVIIGELFNGIIWGLKRRECPALLSEGHNCFWLVPDGTALT